MAYYTQTNLIVPDGEEPDRLVRVPASAVAPGEGGHSTADAGGPHPLPALLAGPIIRRANPGSVTFWFATSAPLRVTVVIYRQQGGRWVPIARHSASGRQLGRRLHVTLVAVSRSRNVFPKGEVLAYDATFTTNDDFVFETDDPGPSTPRSDVVSTMVSGRGLVPRREICYGDAPRPTFVIPDPQVRQVSFVHASCRKMHGGGRDQMEGLDQLLAETQPAQRPTSLFLTGDQVYGDDVHADLLRAINQVSELLLGFSEFTDAGRRVSEMGPEARASIVITPHTGLTSGEAGNHLVGFGDFAAIYLLTWAPALWACSAITNRAFFDERRRAIRGTRRVFAHTPTYMIFDDHELTDDFPLDQSQFNQATQNETGRFVLANGLAACVAFQLEGNGPSTGVAIVLRHLRVYVEAGLAAGVRSRMGDEYRHAARSYSWNIMRGSGDRGSGGDDATTHRARGFSFSSGAVPPVIFVDTRTQRDLGAAGTGPGLVNAEGRSWLEQELAHLRHYPGPLLVVSPTPVVELPPAGLPQRIITGAATDAEAWSLNRTNLSAFLAVFQRAGRHNIVFLSGDVHYAFFAVAESTHRRVVQLTSSALRNEPSAGLAAAALEAAPNPQQAWQSPVGITQFRLCIGNETVCIRSNFGHCTLTWADDGSGTITQKLYASAGTTQRQQYAFPANGS